MAIKSKYQIESVLKRHIGSIIQIVIWDNDGLTLKEGNLTVVNNSSINILSKISKEGNLSIPFDKNGETYILHIYNSVYIDIFNGKETIPFSNKLKTGDFQVLIDSLKPNLNEIVHIVFKQTNGIGVTNGKFTDMGISELIVKPAPFFNTTQRLNYQNILHIYKDNDDDLIG